MTTSDGLHASIAASLVVANLSFTTLVSKGPLGSDVRTFKLPYKIRTHDCEVTGYAAGAVLTVVAAVRVAVPANELTAKRHELADFVADRVPTIRLLPHPYSDPPGDENVIWVESSVPLPQGGEPIEPWLAVTPFVAVAGAIGLLAQQFPEVTPAIASSFPMFKSERSGSVTNSPTIDDGKTRTPQGEGSVSGTSA